MSHGPFRTTTYHEMEHGGEPWPDKSGSPPENCQVFLRDVGSYLARHALSFSCAWRLTSPRLSRASTDGCSTQKDVHLSTNPLPAAGCLAGFAFWRRRDF